jgi:hypothetical protein
MAAKVGELRRAMIRSMAMRPQSLPPLSIARLSRSRTQEIFETERSEGPREGQGVG